VCMYSTVLSSLVQSSTALRAHRSSPERWGENQSTCPNRLIYFGSSRSFFLGEAVNPEDAIVICPIFSFHCSHMPAQSPGGHSRQVAISQPPSLFIRLYITRAFPLVQKIMGVVRERKYNTNSNTWDFATPSSPLSSGKSRNNMTGIILV
jgi:hypothetical protein